MLEQDLVKWLAELTALPVYYQHIDQQPAEKFVWFTRNGDDSTDCLDELGEEPDIVYFDVELYASSAIELQEKTKLLRSGRDYRGDLDTGWVDDIAIADQRDDYQPQANAESLPPFMSAYRFTVTGYIPAESIP